MKKTLITMCAMMVASLAFTLKAWSEYTDDCITFSSAASFTLKTSKNWDGTLRTSTDKTNWTEWNGTEVSAARMGGTYNLYVRGDANNTMIAGKKSYYRWVLTGSNIACSGNIETLRGATGNSPSPTQMANYCYGYMFYGCTALTDAPALPATTLAICCYEYMFDGCTSLTKAPALPATTLAASCYYFMFYGCTALEVDAEAPGKEWKIPVVSTTATNWGDNMFTGTKGTLQGQPELNKTYYIRSAQMTAQQRYPWNGKVDISFTVESAETEAGDLSVWAVDQTTGITNVARNVTGDASYASGQHKIVWDMSADGLTLVSTNVVFGVSYEKAKNLYCVVDISEPVHVDLTPGTRTAGKTETITYSTAWVGGAGEGVVAVVSANGEVIRQQSGSGIVEWTPPKNGTYVLTHKVLEGRSQVGETLTSTFEVNVFPTVITNVTAQQRYPWNGKVDISYAVENAGTNELVLSVWAVDQTTGITNFAKTVSGDTAYANGSHKIVWDMSADGLTFASTNVVFGVAYKEPLYCVIDLAGGTSASSSYLPDVPSGGWKLRGQTPRKGRFTGGCVDLRLARRLAFEVNLRLQVGAFP